MELRELIESIDIVEFISQFVELEQRGDEWWGLSCFKEEHTPSFSVRRSPPVFYDYSSGFGGNVFSFAKRYFNCSGHQAVEKLKQFAGISGEVMFPREKMSAALVCRRFSKQNHTPKQFTGTILPEKCMEKYEKDYEKLKIWEQEGISRASLDKFQVYYDRFADRLVYPIRSVDGKIVNIGGRTLDPCWKDKKMRKYLYYYSWGTVNTIYGLAENMRDIRKKREIILFEGCKSVLLADTWGINNTGAILTSHLNQNQLKILIKLGCRVVFALDKDVNVRDDKNIEKLKRYVSVEYIKDRGNLLCEKDSPVDRGENVFKELYEKRIRLK